MKKRTPSAPIAFAAGKSGGHILPCLTLANRMRAHNSTLTTIFFSHATPLDNQLLHDHPDISVHIPLPITALTVRKPWRLPLQGINLTRSFISAFWTLATTRPSKVITTGGIVALPVCLSAYVLRIPFELWELNAVPGKATALLARLAQRVHVCFATCRTYFPATPCSIEAYPLAARIQQSASSSRTRRPRATLLVVGGSQGSRMLNTFVKTWVEQSTLPRAALRIIHQTGEVDTIAAWNAWYQEQGVSADVFAYRDTLADHYHEADLILCRAGAGSLFEALALRKPCIVVPLETQATDHQLTNAEAMRQEHPKLFQVIRQRAIELNPTVLHKALDSALHRSLR